MFTGVQLYNFRKELKEDFKGTLKAIAELGFDSVEFAFNLGDMGPEELSAYLKEIHLGCCGMQMPPEQLLDKDHQVYQYAKALKTPAVSISADLNFACRWPLVAGTCIAIARNAAQVDGLVFSYHNHWNEFTMSGDTPAMLKILELTGAENVFWQPDVCWMTRGGADPAELFLRYGNRIRQIHLKDIVNLEDSMTTVPLGEGVIKMDAVISAAKKTDVRYLIFEQDNSADPFFDAAKSLKWLKKRI